MTSPALEPRTPARGAAALLRRVVLAASALLAACGGGTTQYDPFAPQRLFAFGDEASTINRDGSTYSVNGLDAAGNFSCATLPIWVQSLATNFGFVFPECNPENIVEPQARSWAAAGARVSDIGPQIDAQIAAGGFRDRDLTTVFVGTNDILALYAQYPTRSETDLTQEAKALGEATAQHVNRLAALGAKVIVSNLPDLGMTPYARNEALLNSDTDRAALISRLTAAFNVQLGVKILLDGRYVGLVQLDQRTQVIAKAAASLGFSNIASPVCAVALPGCTTATLVPDAAAGSYLWADDRWFSAAGHNQIATLAIDRARRNPF